MDKVSLHFFIRLTSGRMEVKDINLEGGNVEMLVNCYRHGRKGCVIECAKIEIAFDKSALSSSRRHIRRWTGNYSSIFFFFCFPLRPFTVLFDLPRSAEKELDNGETNAQHACSCNVFVLIFLFIARTNDEIFLDFDIVPMMAFSSDIFMNDSLEST